MSWCSRLSPGSWDFFPIDRVYLHAYTANCASKRCCGSPIEGGAKLISNRGKKLKIICSLVILLTIALVPLGGIGDSSAQAAEKPQFQVAPLNPDFLEFWENPPEPFYGYVPPTVDLSHLKEIPVTREMQAGTFPDNFDWRDTGKVTSVKNQNPCGTCWVHGTLAAVESKVLIEESVEYNFSEQNLACCTDPSWVYLIGNRCNGGGNSFMVTDTLAKKGTRLESCDPYSPDTINTDSCNNSCQTIKRITGYRLVADSVDEIDKVKEAIRDHGPVSISYRHANSHMYDGSIYYWPSCTLLTNHMVCIVGWDDDIAHPEGGGSGVWIVKNSWGTDFGDNGYFYLCYGSANMKEVGYFEYKDYDPDEQVYYWDEAGFVGWGGFGDDSAWMASIFTSQQNGSLSNVDFWTTSNNAAYEIYVYRDGDVTDGLQNQVASRAGTCQELGYYSIPLTTPVPLTNGQPFTVAVKMTTPGYDRPIPIEGEISGKCTPPIQSGVCFAKHRHGDPWIDASSEGCNVCLRAKITSAGAPNNPPNQPSNPSPANHALNVPIDSDLSWTGGDPDAGDTVTYAVYFGTSSSPPFKETIGPYPATQSSITYDPGALSYGTQYYWYIVATDNHSESATGPLWEFTTEGAAGQPDITVNPASFEVTLPPDTTQDFTLAIGNVGDAALSYDISDRGTTGGGSAAGVANLRLSPAGMVLKNPLESQVVEPEKAREAQNGWQNIMTEGFEGAFPGTKWERYGNPTWGKESYKPRSGSYSVWCAGSSYDPQLNNYPNDMDAWMIYGPFSLVGATDAELNFWFWNKSQGPHDYVMWGASTDGNWFYGYAVDGDSGGWQSVSFDLTNVYQLGNLCGQSQVWIAFIFESDNAFTAKGAFVDDVVLRKYVAGVNNPPNTPSNPSPSNHAAGMSINADLSWTGADPDAGDTVTYDVYFGTTATPPLVSNDQAGTTYDPGALSYNTKYYWKIVATDNHEASTTGPLWDFTTQAAGNNPPNTPSNPSPVNHAAAVSINADLGWTGGDPDPGDTVTYDVYFGTTATPPLVSPAQAGTTYDPGTLSYNTKYYWKIVATDNHEASITGPLWEFTTGGAAEDCPWLDEGPKSGSVAPGNSDSITVTVDTTGLASDYSAEIVIDNNDPDENPKIVPVTLHVGPVTQANWTVMVYLDADNNLEPDGIRNFNEMEVAGSTEDVNIIVLMDRIPGYDISNGDWTGARLYRVNKDTDPDIIHSQLLQDKGEINMGDPNTLIDFATWTIQNYPAEHYLLCLWDHGSGWKSRPMPIKGVCWDDSSNADYITSQELRSALLMIKQQTGIDKLDILGFDACFMGMLEVDYQVMPFVDISVGSEEISYGGFNYANTLVSLTNAPTMAPSVLATHIVDDYIAIFQYYPDYAVTMSAVDLSQTGTLASSVSDFATSLMNSGNWNGIDQARYQAESYYDPDYIDLYDFARLVKQSVSDVGVQSSADQVMTGVTSAVVAQGQNLHPNSHGISIYFPTEEYGYMPYYEDLAFANTQWDEFLHWYYNNAPPPQWNPCITDPDEGVNPDILGVDYSLTTAHISFRTRTVQDIEASCNFLGNTFLDVDQNAATGFAVNDIGADYVAQTYLLPQQSMQVMSTIPLSPQSKDILKRINATSGDGALLVWNAATQDFDIVTEIPSSFDGNNNEFDILLADLDNDDGNMDIVQMGGKFVGGVPELTDIAPNTGHGTVVATGPTNNPPNMPGNPLPPNHAPNVSIPANLSWTGGDPDVGDTATYAVYFGTSSSPPFKETIGPYPATQSSITYDPGTLSYNTKYYWYIVATDNHNASTPAPLTGDIWDFTTSSPSPGELHVGPGQPYATIQDALDDANDGDTIIVHEGTYDGFTVDNKKDLSIVGQDGVTVNSGNVFIDGGEWWVMALVMNSTAINIEGIVFDGGEIRQNVVEGICYVSSTGSITDVIMRNIVGTDGEGSMGLGIFVGGGEIGTVEILGVTVENVTNGIMIVNDEVNIRDCSVDGEGITDLGVGIFAMDNAKVTIESSTIINWRGTGYWDAQEAQSIAIGIGFQRGFGPMATSTAEIRGCTIENNIGGISVDSDGRATVNYNNIVGNEFGIFNVGEVPVDATNNWWGDASGPEDGSGDTDCKTPGEGGWNCDTCDKNDGTGDKVSDNVDYCPWLLEPGMAWNFPSTSDVFLCPTPGNNRPYLDAAVDLPTDTKPDELLGVYWLDEATGEWQYFIPAFGGGTLTSLEPGEAYLVAVSGACSWNLPCGEGTALPTGNVWNFPSTSDVFLAPTPANDRPYLDAAVALPIDTEPPELLGVYWLDEATGEWKYFIPAFGGGTLTSLQPGQAYLVAVSGACNWQISQE